MPSILERLRAALRPEYELERELASGGMGTVFLARDINLDRPVAIKIIRPELATARATERFLHEARILASLSHPNVVPVHRAGEAGGFSYYVMDHVQGETLSERLEQGPLSPDEALKLGRDLLDALEAVHRLGVVHRDIKPSNIFLIGGRALLADFGIAKPSDAPPATGGVRGTPGYMPPEQAFGMDVSPQTDLYALAMVLYESFTGRRWQALLQSGEKDHDWSGVPRPVLSILRRGLAWEPADRWPDAAAFRHALWRTRTRKYRRRTAILTASALLVGALTVWFVVRERPTVTDVAILPFAPGPGVDSAFTQKLTLLTSYHLGFSFAKLTDADDLLAWWNALGLSIDSIDNDAMRELGARYVAHATVAASDGDTSVTIVLIDRDAQQYPGGTVHLGVPGLAQMGNRLGYLIAEHVAPSRASQYEGSPALSDISDPALTAFLDGERAFERNDWNSAVERYVAALAIDSNFALAEWRYFNAWRWLATGETPPMNIARLYAEYREVLPQLDRLLLEAQLAQELSRRLELYQRVLELYPRSAYAAFLYGDELLHRGSLVGTSLETAAEQLASATTKDSSFAPALGHLVWVSLRLGHEDEANRALTRFTEVAAPREEVDFYEPPLLELALGARFASEDAGALVAEIAQQPEDLAGLARAFRLAASFGLHQLQAEIGAMLATDPRLDRSGRASAHEGRGLGLIATGQIAEAMAHFDSAALLFDTPEARIEAAEWRVIGDALGLPGIAREEVDSGRLALEEMITAPAIGPRAAWALGVDAAARGEPVGHWMDLLSARSDTSAARFAQLLYALDMGRRAEYESALATSQPILAYDSAGVGGDPFVQAVLHLRRAEWLEHLGRLRAAGSMRVWYENFNNHGLPNGPAQASEVDWALSPHVDWLRAEAALAHHDERAACTYFERVLIPWANADSAYVPLRSRAEEHAQQACK